MKLYNEENIVLVGNLLLLFKEYKKKLKIVGKTSCVRPFEFHETLDLPFFRRD